MRGPHERRDLESDRQAEAIEIAAPAPAKDELPARASLIGNAAFARHVARAPTGVGVQEAKLRGRDLGRTLEARVDRVSGPSGALA